MKSALFVDFDNIYSGLRRLDQLIADRFALQPLGWIRWLAESLPAPPHSPIDGKRRLLVRRCYLNPQVYQRFRPAFNRAGFEIVDCPAMTREGKTSTDIHMVLDIVDLLQHEAHYDEFIVLSADADFTPVLRKLRRWDRRTTVLAIGFPSAAYQASADLLIDQDDFIRAALGFDEPDEAPPPVPSATLPSDAAGRLASFIAIVVRESGRPVALPWLASRAPREVPGLDPATWGGHGSFRALVDSLRLEPLQVNWEFGVVLDPVRHALPERAAGSTKPVADDVSAQEVIAQLVRDEVGRASRPVPCARLAQLITDQHGAIAADWGGKGSFRKFLDALSLKPLRIDWAIGGGQVVDPRRMYDGDPASTATRRDPSDADDELLPLLGQVRAAIGMPVLSPDELQFVLGSLADDLALQPFHLTETGKRVRDRCRDAGHAVSRDDVSFVLKGILHGGHSFGNGADDVHTLGRTFVDSVLELCRREQLILDDTQVARLNSLLTRTVDTR